VTYTPPGARSSAAAPRLVALRVYLASVRGRRLVDLLVPHAASADEAFDAAVRELQQREPNAETWRLDRIEIGHEPLHVR
jgi:hypothetical protein